MASLEEFEEQLKQEALAKETEAAQTTETEYTVGGKLFRKDADGTVFEFDPEKRAWFPKIDEDFLARYQMSYGTGADPSSVDPASYTESYWSNPPTDINSEEYRNWYHQYCSYFFPQQYMDQAASVLGNATADIPSIPSNISQEFADPVNVHANIAPSAAEEGKDANPENDGKKKKKKKNDDLLTKHKPVEPPAWFELEDDRNTNVYVSGLPEDVTEDEFKDFMSKVGVLAFDPIMRKPKIKLYTNADGTYKGDGRCCYIKAESVDLALQILDGSDLRGHIISVERARFELKGAYDPSKKRRKLTKQEKKKWREKQEKILGWQPEKPADARPRCERIVVIKYAFLPQQFERDPAQLNEVSADFREECSKYGDVRKVVVCDRHPDGVVLVTFQQPEEADLCVAAVNRRWFDGRQLEASNWDGRTKYQIKETEEEMEKRLNTWHSFIESDDKESSTMSKPAESDSPRKTEELERLEKHDGGTEKLAVEDRDVTKEPEVAVDQSEVESK